MEKFTNIQAKELFKGKFVISNNDGTIWTANKAYVYSHHQEEYNSVASEWETLESKRKGVNSFGIKKVRFENLEKTKYIRKQFSNDFTKGTLESVCDLMTKDIEKIKVPQKQD